MEFLSDNDNLLVMRRNNRIKLGVHFPFKGVISHLNLIIFKDVVTVVKFVVKLIHMYFEFTIFATMYIYNVHTCTFLAGITPNLAFFIMVHFLIC